MQPAPAFRRFVSGVMGKALAATLVVLVSAASATGEEILPILSACMPATTPALPQRWHAVGLMLPFLRQQLDVGDFTYDGSLPALRATVYGLESGAVDLLITNTETYQLTGPPDSPTAALRSAASTLPRAHGSPTNQSAKAKRRLGTRRCNGGNHRRLTAALSWNGMPLTQSCRGA